MDEDEDDEDEDDEEDDDEDNEDEDGAATANFIFSSNRSWINFALFATSAFNFIVTFRNLSKLGNDADFLAMVGRCTAKAVFNQCTACSRGKPRRRKNANTMHGLRDLPFLQNTMHFLFFTNCKCIHEA